MVAVRVSRQESVLQVSTLEDIRLQREAMSCMKGIKTHEKLSFRPEKVWLMAYMKRITINLSVFPMSFLFLLMAENPFPFVDRGSGWELVSNLYCGFWVPDNVWLPEAGHWKVMGTKSITACILHCLFPDF